jgi:hypothetical protein
LILPAEIDWIYKLKTFLVKCQQRRPKFQKKAFSKGY